MNHSTAVVLALGVVFIALSCAQSSNFAVTGAASMQGPPPYDEDLARQAMRISFATYAGFHTDARFVMVPALNCSVQQCSLPSTLNVSFLRHREVLGGGHGTVIVTISG